MTILPKKKQSKEKNEGGNVDKATHPPSGSGAHGGRPTSPPQRWTSPPPVDTASLDAGGRFDPLEGGSSGHNKRRHRSSPHRNLGTRKHRSAHSTYESAVAAGHSGHSLRHSGYRHDRHDRPSTSKDRGSEFDEEQELGYNSEDEYTSPRHPENLEQLERWFEEELKEKCGFVIKKMGEDGACLFRSVADQVFGDQEMHSIVRNNCVDYMAKNRDFFRQYVTEDFETYLNRKRMDNCHGNHTEMQAMCELYNRPIEVYQYSTEPINTFHGAYKTDNEPVRLSYHGSVHYNSVVDPCKATIGVGLGLPGYQPGLAEKNLMHDAKQASEQLHIEQTMLEDKKRETDWEVTQETIEEQVARESYLQWLRDQDKLAMSSQGASHTASAACSSASEQTRWEGATGSKSPQDSRPTRSPRNRSANNSAQNSPNRPDLTDTGLLLEPQPAMDQLLLTPGGSVSPKAHASGSAGYDESSHQGGMSEEAAFNESASFLRDLSPKMFGLTGSKWDEDDILAQVIAQSQQEYLDTLKRAVTVATDTLATTSVSHSNMTGGFSSTSSSKVPHDKRS